MSEEQDQPAGGEFVQQQDGGRQVQETPNNQRRREAREAMLADVVSRRGDISKLLTPFGVDFDLFEAGFRIFTLRQMQIAPDFFIQVSAVSFMESLFRIAMNGLIPDGKEAAIANYKGTATPMFMRDGFVKVLWRTGLVRSINDGVVTKAEDDAGRFEYEEGDRGFIRHRPLMSRKDSDPVVAAYCVIEMVGGGILREVVPEGELIKIRNMSRGDARKNWPHQMDRKAPLRRIMGKMPREKAIVQLLTDDEAAYDLKAVPPPPPQPSGVRARLEAQQSTVARPGFAPGHAEAQLGPRAPDELDQRISEAGGADDFPGDRAAPEPPADLAWADAQRARLAGLKTVDALDEMVDAPEFTGSMALLKQDNPAAAKGLEAAITGRRKALADKERR